MYRSVTFSEIFSSTLSDDLNKCDNSYDSNVKSRFVAKIGIALIEFLLSSIFLCYGIIFSECVNNQYYTPENGLWTTILYVSTWNFTGSWSRLICNYFENNRFAVFRYVIGITVLLLFFGLIIPNQILSFGVFGGIFSNFIYTQLKKVAVERYNMDSKVFEGNIQVARALTLLIMPHFTLLLISYYSIFQVQVLLAAFLLNVFPAALLIKHQGDCPKYAEISRYQTLPAFSSQVKEMMSFTNSINVSDSQKSETTSLEDENEGERDITSTAVHDELPYSYDHIYVREHALQPSYLTPLTVETYYKNAGVSILPQIPEEGEIDDEENVTCGSNTNNLKDRTKVTAKLKEITQQTKARVQEYSYNERAKIPDIIYLNGKSDKIEMDNKTEVLDIKALVSNTYVNGCENIQNIEYIPNYTEGTNNVNFFKEIKSLRKDCGCCTPYRKFIWRRRIRSISDFFLDNVFNPFLESLKDLHFYPTVMSKVTTSITSTIYITLAPYFASQMNLDFQPEDATFLLSYIAFSWCLFLVLIPLIINFSRGKVRVTFICGLLLIGTSMTLISRKMTNDIITISCLMFGFGYGATNFTENMVYKSFVGSRKWSTIKGSIETTSALFVIFIYYIIYKLKLSLRILLFMAFISFYVNAILWIIAPILKKMIIGIIKRYSSRRSKHHSFLGEQY